MNTDELYSALDGLHAFDSGAMDSGISDEAIRRQVCDYLGSVSDTERRLLLSRFVREHYLTEEALAAGYGIGDVADFIEWLDQYLGVAL